MGNPAAEFAALMSGAAAQAAPPEQDAPYGYTRDRSTGELRPKKVPGRPRSRPPSVDELKAAQEQDQDQDPAGTAATAPPAEDRAPDEKGRHRRPGPAQDPAGAEGVAYVPGRIARGMDRLYRRAGKIYKAIDPVVGQALIEVTRKDDDDDITVGEAWEELARTNPRIRRVLTRLISGGAYGQLAAAHGPILLAVLMKPAVLKHIPFSRLIEALAERDEDPGEGQADAPGPEEGLQPADMQQILTLASRFANGFGSHGASLAPPGTHQEAA